MLSREQYEVIRGALPEDPKRRASGDHVVASLLVAIEALLEVARTHFLELQEEWKRLASEGGTELSLPDWLDFHYPDLAKLKPWMLEGE